ASSRSASRRSSGSNGSWMSIGTYSIMLAIDQLLIKIRRRETPWADRAYRFAKALRRIHLPVIPGLHHLLYEERRLRRTLFGTLGRVLYYEPLFRTQCAQVGRNFRLI